MRELGFRIATQRRNLIRSSLWLPVAVLAVAAVIDTLSLGAGSSNALESGPTLLVLVALFAAARLNGRGHTTSAVGLMVGATFLSASVPLLLLGLGAGTGGMFMLFVPVTIAGLLLDRKALYLTVALALAVIVAALRLHPSGALSGGALDMGRVALQFAVAFSVVTLFVERFGAVLQSAQREALEHELKRSYKEQQLQDAREVIRETRRFDDAVLEHLPGIFYVVDEEGEHLRWNRNYALALGYSHEEIAAMNPSALLDDGERSRFEAYAAAVLASGHSTLQARFRTKDGRLVPYFLNGTSVTLGGKQYVASLGTDRSEIDAVNEQVRELNHRLIDRVERLRALREIDKATTEGLDLSRALHIILEQTTLRMGVDAAAILLHDPDRGVLRFGAGLGLGDGATSDWILPAERGLAWAACRKREVILLNGAEALERAFARYGDLRGQGFVSYVAVPLIAKHEVMGVLELFHHATVVLEGDRADFLRSLADQAALALDNAAMMEGLERTNEELGLAYEKTIEGWARALDLRDGETAGHSQRVTEQAVRLARHMGVPEHDLVHLKRGALLHDIGKMAVPDAILTKRGPLTDAEWEVMRQHPAFAHALLAPIPYLEQALPIPYCHHERWDGRGYPRGLRGTQIPLPARIFSVVDVYDAVTSDRRYRKAWPRSRALRFIRDGAGTRFDPAVVRAFVELADQGSSPGQV